MKQTLNDMSGQGIKPCRLDFKDEDGKITIGLDDEGNYDVLGSKITQNHIDKMIFIMNNHDITDKAYHEMTQKCLYLPRSYLVKKNKTK